MSNRITATQEDPSNPGPEEWRPSPVADNEKSKFLAEWGEGADKPAKAKPAPAGDADDDPDDDTDLDDDDADAVVDGEEEEEEEEDEEPAPKAKTAKGKPAPAAPADDDEEEEEDPDDDSDLDEEDKPADGKPEDPAVAKGMLKLQRAEQRMRDQFTRERETARAEVARERAEAKAERELGAAAQAKYEALAARARLDPLGALEELGVDDIEYVGQQAYVAKQAATDPRYKEAAARMKSEKEMKVKLAALEKKDADRDKTETEAKRRAAEQQDAIAIIDTIAKSAANVTKAELTQRALKNDPGYAKALLAQAYLELGNRNGVAPSPKEVVIAAEKLQRAQLRRYGISPKSVLKASASAGDQTVDKSAKPNGKIANGKNGKKPVRTADDDDELTPPTREQLLAEDWKL